MDWKPYDPCCLLMCVFALAADFSLSRLYLQNALGKKGGENVRVFLFAENSKYQSNTFEPVRNQSRKVLHAGMSTGLFHFLLNTLSSKSFLLHWNMFSYAVMRKVKPELF